ncbi:Glycosyl hydrolase, BNR repeat precursor [hydrothermal vent metagenome]|uniref:Glycosyl hydrolase, BNR repeat n=1 Tax=hydrothermal vent metagenome TaxID=652676 RepID=A0A160VDS9_9ZZZZ
MKKTLLIFIPFLSLLGQSISTDQLDQLTFRNIGPSVAGGRIHDIEVLPNDPATVFIASASGGIWKSSNKGTTWKPVFDDQAVSTFGDMAISLSNPDVIYAGSGEQQNRQSTSWGNGIYKSENQGETWRSIGLEKTYHIARVIIHPENPNIVFVAALGNLWNSSKERGVYQTTNGGKNWKKVLYIDDMTGVVDMAMDKNNPNILYAATYQRMRKAWGFNGGGPGSGIYKTTDGGKTWNELTGGLPPGDKGRIGLAASKTRSNIIYATIEHADSSGFYRSGNGGRTWKRVNKLNPRPMYYSHIFVDPNNDDIVYMLATEFYRTKDAGKTFYQMPTRPTYDVGVHSDHHTLWINPNNSNHFFLAGDAGLHESWDGGVAYNRLNNIPIGQFYGIGADMEVPYNIYGGMQDNHSWMGPSATRHWLGILADDWKQVGFGDGMYQQPDPESSMLYNASQNGNMIRVDRKTGNMQGLKPFPSDSKEKYRFDWVTPLAISKHSSKKVFLGGNRLFISDNGGDSWEQTEDLSSNTNRDSLTIMGVLGADIKLSKNDGTSSYGEIISISESPLWHRVIWVGTDDGNIQVSRDGGEKWEEVSGNITGIPAGSYVSRVLSSIRDRGSAYVTFDRHREGDWKPYVYRTEDYGKTWVPLTRGLPSGSVNVIAEHPDNPDVLFLGTEHAVYLSVNAGSDWTKFKSNLPTTLYDDLLIHPREKDLVLGTHGRSFWVLDDTSPLAEWSTVYNKPVHVFSVRAATLFHYWKDTSYRAQEEWAGENPPYGAIISYLVNSDVDSVTITVKRRKSQIIRTYRQPVVKGSIQRLAWDLKYPPPSSQQNESKTEGLQKPKPEDILPKPAHPLDPQGPSVSPGVYTVTIAAGNETSTQPIRVNPDPKLNLKVGDYRQQEKFLVKLMVIYENAYAMNEKLKSKIKDLEELLDKDDEKLINVKDQQKQVNTIRTGAARLASELKGGGVRQGSFFPPTKTHQDRLLRLQALWVSMAN